MKKRRRTGSRSAQPLWDSLLRHCHHACERDQAFSPLENAVHWRGSTEREEREIYIDRQRQTGRDREGDGDAETETETEGQGQRDGGRRRRREVENECVSATQQKQGITTSIRKPTNHENKKVRVCQEENTTATQNKEWQPWDRKRIIASRGFEICSLCVEERKERQVKINKLKRWRRNQPRSTQSNMTENKILARTYQVSSFFFSKKVTSMREGSITSEI